MDLHSFSHSRLHSFLHSRLHSFSHSVSHSRSRFLLLLPLTEREMRMAMRIGCVASTGNAICKASTNSSEDKDALVAALLLHLKRLGAAYKLVPDQPNAPAALPVDLISSSLTVGHTLDSAQRHSRVSQTDQNFILFRRGQFHSSSTDPC